MPMSHYFLNPLLLWFLSTLFISGSLYLFHQRSLHFLYMMSIIIYILHNGAKYFIVVKYCLIILHRIHQYLRWAYLPVAHERAYRSHLISYHKLFPVLETSASPFGLALSLKLLKMLRVIEGVWHFGLFKSHLGVVYELLIWAAVNYIFMVLDFFWLGLFEMIVEMEMQRVSFGRIWAVKLNIFRINKVHQVF